MVYGIYLYTSMKPYALLNNPNPIDASLVPYFTTWCFSNFRKGLRYEMSPAF